MEIDDIIYLTFIFLCSGFQSRFFHIARIGTSNAIADASQIRSHIKYLIQAV